jgi:mRNA interferase HigB
MNVIAPRTLRAFWKLHPHARVPLRTWLSLFQKHRYENFDAIKDVFSSADGVKGKDGQNLVVFNIGGSKYRLVTFISYKAQRIYIRKIMTHEKYDLWNKQGRP